MYKTIKINSDYSKPFKASLLMIYTGGTMGMVYDTAGKSLVPFDFSEIFQKIPELRRFNVEITVISFEQPLDSSDITPDHWIELGRIIFENYSKHDGFLILHGTDTMAYMASGLSFILENLNKPVVLTGALMPIGEVRTDARENLMMAIEVAAYKKDGNPVVTEVCICFNNFLFRGNRSTKVQSSHFDAFDSGNYPRLAEAGVNIEFNYAALKEYDSTQKIKFYEQLDKEVAILKIFPGIHKSVVDCVLNIPGLKAVVLETFGSGNVPSEPWLREALKKAVEKGIIIYNVSQCLVGSVVHGKYQTSKMLADVGVLSGGSITTEAAIAKLMFGLANVETKSLKDFLTGPARGEMD